MRINGKANISSLLKANQKSVSSFFIDFQEYLLSSLFESPKAKLCTVLCPSFSTLPKRTESYTHPCPTLTHHYCGICKMWLLSWLQLTSYAFILNSTSLHPNSIYWVAAFTATGNITVIKKEKQKQESVYFHDAYILVERVANNK